MNMTRLLFVIPILGLVLLAGCGAPPPADPGPIAPDPSSTSADPAETKVPTGSIAIDVSTISLSPDQMEQVKKLPEADQATALAQKVCPVTGENLGSMGELVKVDVKGQPVFLCCAGCKEDVAKDPDTVLAKLGKSPAEADSAEPEPTATP